MTDLTDNAARHRFEMATEAGTAFVTYVRAGDRLLLTHAEVPRAVEGRGVGSALVRAVLEEVRRRGQRAVPACPFVAAFVRGHPEFTDIVAAGSADPD